MVFYTSSVTPIESFNLPESKTWIKTASHTAILLRPISTRHLPIWMLKFLILSRNYCLEIRASKHHQTTMRLKLSLSLNQDHVEDIYVGKDIRITYNSY
jgi:hypothetical protein